MKSGFVAFMAAALLPAMAVAQTPTADIAPRTELHAIPTMTVSGSDFVVGKEGKPVERPTAPGLGISLDPAFVEQHPYKPGALEYA